MLEELLTKKLELSAENSRHFLMSVSGGMDSSLLLFGLQKLRKDYPIRVTVLHINYGLRGEASREDEKLVQEVCSKWEIPLVISRVSQKFETAVQEQARQWRLDLSQRVLPSAEWVEAHHRDDQVETFLFRLFRGTGLSGLCGMTEKSFRGGRRVWRPFLSLPKAKILSLVKENEIEFREDESNQSVIYDRNWIRRELLPLIEQRFPHVRESVLRVQEQVQKEEFYFAQLQEELETRLVIKDQKEFFGLKLDWHGLMDLSEVVLERFLHRILQRRLGCSMGRQRVHELAQTIKLGDDFSFNLPQNFVIKSAQRLLVLKKLPGRKGFEE